MLLHHLSFYLSTIVNRAVSKKGKWRFKNAPQRLLLKKELELGEHEVALSEKEKAFYLEAYTAEMVGLWRNADASMREGLVKAFYEATGKDLHTEVKQCITRVLQQQWCGRQLREELSHSVAQGSTQGRSILLRGEFDQYALHGSHSASHK
jgi:hypothetical protein